MRAFLLVAVLSLLACSALCERWALLVAGSNGYYNYRHQSDICHAYHVLHSHGIPDDRIVVMMYDDIAHSRENPFPGNIINKPGGKNVYPGVLKDYVGHDVTPDVFLKVLTGDENGLEKTLGRKGKVIKSGPNDHVFVYFADHGAPGLIAFPDDELHAKPLNDAILKMHANKQYKEMVFYIEACESGSMFDNLLKKNINVYATTAANPDESSYACYYDKTRKTYLGDLYSVKWLEDSDAENLNTETLEQQFRIVKKETNMSHVMEYGDLSISRQTVGVFQGNGSSKQLDQQQHVPAYYTDAAAGAIPSQDVQLEYLKRRAASAEGLQEQRSYERSYRELVSRNKEVRKFFKRVAHIASDNKDYVDLLRTSVKFTDFTCYMESVETIKRSCPGMKLSQNDMALRNLRVLANLCETRVPMQRVWAAISYAAGDCPIC